MSGQAFENHVIGGECGVRLLEVADIGIVGLTVGIRCVAEVHGLFNFRKFNSCSCTLHILLVVSHSKRGP